MPKGKKSKIPPWGRSQKDLDKDYGLDKFQGNVPLGNNDPTVREGVLYGGMPNRSRTARGGLKQYKGKYT